MPHKGYVLVTCEECEDRDVAPVDEQGRMLLPEDWHWEPDGEYLALFCHDCEGDRI